MTPPDAALTAALKRLYSVHDPAPIQRVVFDGDLALVAARLQVQEDAIIARMAARDQEMFLTMKARLQAQAEEIAALKAAAAERLHIALGGIPHGQ